MFCPHCGYRNKGGARFCEQCGNALAGSAGQSQPPPMVVMVGSQREGQSFFRFLMMLGSYLLTGLVAGFLLIEIFPHIRPFLPPWVLDFLAGSPNLR